ncbi:MAG: SRPBCC family protein [Thermomicrobiales bacterium]
MSIQPTGRVIQTVDGLAIAIERQFSAPIEDVWASIVEPERMNRWIGTWSGTPGVGNTVDFFMTAEGDVPAEPTFIHECDPPRRLRVQSSVGEDSWMMAITLTESDGITTLTFIQDVTDRTTVGDTGPGWEYYADRLVATFTGESFAEWNAYYPAQQDYWLAALQAASAES